MYSMEDVLAGSQLGSPMDDGYTQDRCLYTPGITGPGPKCRALLPRSTCILGPVPVPTRGLLVPRHDTTQYGMAEDGEGWGGNGEGLRRS